jgi:hypothetical protein
MNRHNAQRMLRAANPAARVYHARLSVYPSIRIEGYLPR